MKMRPRGARKGLIAGSWEECEQGRATSWYGSEVVDASIRGGCYKPAMGVKRGKEDRIDTRTYVQGGNLSSKGGGGTPQKHMAMREEMTTPISSIHDYPAFEQWGHLCTKLRTLSGWIGIPRNFLNLNSVDVLERPRDS